MWYVALSCYLAAGKCYTDAAPSSFMTSVAHSQKWNDKKDKMLEMNLLYDGSKNRNHSLHSTIGYIKRVTEFEAYSVVGLAYIANHCIWWMGWSALIIDCIYINPLYEFITAKLSNFHESCVDHHMHISSHVILYERIIFSVPVIPYHFPTSIVPSLWKTWPAD